MRLVLRVLFFEFALSWAMILAGQVRVAVQVWPFVKRPLHAGFHSRAWRMGLGLLIGVPVVAGWPALFSLSQPESVGGDWLKVAIPWWILVGVLGAEMLVARLTVGK